MIQNEPDFYTVIREESKYCGQDGGKPFPVNLDHDMSGYLWKGNSNRYRPLDLWLFKPTSDPTVEQHAPVSLVFDDTPATEDEAEAGYQVSLQETQCFSPLPHQGREGETFYIHRNGKR
ncbi:MAG: hypothetical protein ABFS45_16255 [Pseudomonadota bacterium]